LRSLRFLCGLCDPKKMHQRELANSKVCTYIVAYSIAKDAKITAKDAKKTPWRSLRFLCGLCDPKKYNRSLLEILRNVTKENTASFTTPTVSQRSQRLPQRAQRKPFSVAYRIAKSAKLTAEGAKKTPWRSLRFLCGLCDPKKMQQQPLRKY
jgi:hypothetical protein